MKKNIFIGSKTGKKIKSKAIEEFVDDLKYTIELKFDSDSIQYTESESDANFNIFIIGEDEQFEKITADSKNLYLNFSKHTPNFRSRYIIDLSKTIENQNKEGQEKTYWDSITDITFHLAKSDQEEFNKTAFVSEVSPDQLENRKSIIRELEQKRYKILPEKPLGQMASSDIKENLKNSDFSIHIIGEEELACKEGEDQDLVFLQNEIAAEHSSLNKEFKRFIYIPSNLNPPQNQQIKIEKIKRKASHLVGGEIIESGIEKFKSEIFQKLTRKKAKHEIVDMEGNLLYIINGINFKSETKAIRNQLESASLDLIAIDSFDGSLDFLHQHKGNLLKASSILIINSEENNHWLSSMLDDVLKSYGFGKQRAFDLVGIISKQKIQYFSQLELINYMEINDSTSKPKEDHLRQFLQAIKSARK